MSPLNQVEMMLGRLCIFYKDAKLRKGGLCFLGCKLGPSICDNPLWLFFTLMAGQIENNCILQEWSSENCLYLLLAQAGRDRPPAGSRRSSLGDDRGHPWGLATGKRYSLFSSERAGSIQAEKNNEIAGFSLQLQTLLLGAKLLVCPCHRPPPPLGWGGGRSSVMLSSISSGISLTLTLF